ncbi:hypothetical protein FQN50_002202 [Emmonsiellopsis sp. PD_5]|nr:hypothetical protein FQN50_002202 [Emmonsiellopsis sp. PD_5]
MQFDRIAEARWDRMFAQWVQFLLRGSPEQLAISLAGKHLGGSQRQACQWRNGAFNVCYRVRSDSGLEAVVRFSALGRTVFRTEKVENEVVVLRFLRENTAIPVPEVFGTGKIHTGPFIVMSYINGTPLANIIKDPSVAGQPVLNPRISERDLRRAYREMCKLLLELSKPEFPKIGALVESPDGKFIVARRAFTFGMNELSTLANIPRHVFPETVLETAHDYFTHLASQHVSHFLLQRNDAIEDEADCRKKFVARCLFRKLIRQHVQFEHNHGPFRLYCDDFRPSNVLVDIEKQRISAAIDWEFTYAAPAEFSYVAPWWLLLQGPEGWDSNLAEFFAAQFMPRFHIFLGALRAAEEEMIAHDTLQDNQRLSRHMEKSLDNGLFWLCLAARNSQMFDEVYWTFIDQVYYGKYASVEDRAEKHLDEAERDMLARIYQIKMEQAKDGKIDEHYSIDEAMDL